MSESVTVGFNTIHGFIPDAGLVETTEDHVAMLMGYRGVTRTDTAQVRITISEGGTTLYQKTVSVFRKAVSEKRTLTIAEKDYGTTPLLPSNYKTITFDETKWTQVSGQPSKQQVGSTVEITVSGVSSSNYHVLKIEWTDSQSGVYAYMHIIYRFSSGKIYHITQRFELLAGTNVYILLPWEPDHELKVVIVPEDPTQTVNPDIINAVLYDTGEAKDVYTSVDVTVEYLDSGGNVIGSGSATANLYLAILKKVESEVSQATIMGIVG